MQKTALAFFHSLDDVSRKDCFDQLAVVIAPNAEEYAGHFYANFLYNEEASAFLSQTIVQQRLMGSLRNWLLDLVQIRTDDDLPAFEARQRTIGAIHARIKIPVHLVLEGASLLKREIARALLRRNANEAIAAVILMNEMIDYAMLHMSKAYTKDATERVQVDEAYRLFSLGHDTELERETQKAALMEWGQKVLFEILGARSSLQIEPLASAPFGMWVRHRAAVVFEDSLMLSHIRRAMDEIDYVLLPKLFVPEERSPAVARLYVLLEELKYLLNDLFQSLSAASNARDPLTSALTRRFLPSILGREVMVANQQKIPLSVLMSDVDFFKSINDKWGHSAGDQILRQMAEVIIANTRPSDYVVRYGGEEFLVILVETDGAEAYQIAEKIRSEFALRAFRLADGETIRATTSIGVAMHDGHPDFQRLIDAADRALYKAKSEGRNRTAT